jgi:hypothetical protein
MRLSSGRIASGVLLLLAVLVPLLIIGWMAGAIAPQLVEPLSYQLRSYLANTSASVLDGLKAVLGTVAVVGLALYATYLLITLGSSLLEAFSAPSDDSAETESHADVVAARPDEVMGPDLSYRRQNVLERSVPEATRRIRGSAGSSTRGVNWETRKTMRRA